MSQPVRPAAEDGDLAGRTLGDFKLLRRLGRGAMAEVYLAEQQSLRRQVALKVLKLALAGDVNYVQRFQNEARAAASLVHANIVQIYEVGFAEGVHYIAQEYVQGMNLREWMQRNGPPDVKLTVAVMRQTAAALHKAAQAGIVHRDIKPENIMLSNTGEVKVADFGLARIAREDDVLHLTQVGITMGTPLYMSPEQVEGKPLDSRSDLYSFGVTCYHLLAGAPPFLGETALAVAVQHLNTPPRRLEELRPDVPPGLARIVHKLIEKKSSARYATARELLADLRALPIAADDDADAWAAAVDERTAHELANTLGMHSARSKLDELMKTSALVLQQKQRDKWPRRVAIAAVAALLVGGLTAVVKARRTPSVLAGARDATTVTIPKQESGRAQFAAAQMQLTDVEDWLLSVERYFPNDAYFVDRSKQELARRYWKEGRLDEALPLFEHFAERLEEEYRAFGLAGRSLVQTKRGELEAAAQTLGQVLPLQAKLDPRMAQEMSFAIAANRQALRDKGLLPDEPSSTVPKQATAQEQLALAHWQLGDKEKEDSLRSVAIYFPQDSYYVLQSKLELALHYLELNRRSEALPLFVELGNREGAERGFRASGFAGQVILAAQENDALRCRRALEQFLPLADAVDPAVGRLLAATPLPAELKMPPTVREVWDAFRDRVLATGKSNG
jgi:serine/threonine-protein kinase